MPSKKSDSALAMFEAAGRAAAARPRADGPTARETAIIDREALNTARSWVSYADPADDEPETDEVEALAEGDSAWREAFATMMRERGAYDADPGTEDREATRLDGFWYLFVRSVKRQARELRAASRRKGSRRR